MNFGGASGDLVEPSQDELANFGRDHPLDSMERRHSVLDEYESGDASGDGRKAVIGSREESQSDDVADVA